MPANDIGIPAVQADGPTRTLRPGQRPSSDRRAPMLGQQPTRLHEALHRHAGPAPCSDRALRPSTRRWSSGLDRVAGIHAKNIHQQIPPHALTRTRRLHDSASHQVGRRACGSAGHDDVAPNALGPLGMCPCFGCRASPRGRRAMMAVAQVGGALALTPSSRIRAARGGQRLIGRHGTTCRLEDVVANCGRLVFRGPAANAARDHRIRQCHRGRDATCPRLARGHPRLMFRASRTQLREIQLIQSSPVTRHVLPRPD
jgi:hypothetical protein